MDNVSYGWEFFKLLIAAFLGLLGGYCGSLWKEAHVRRRLFDELQAFDAPFHARCARARIFNGSDYSMTDCWAYITVNYEHSDIIDWDYDAIDPETGIVRPIPATHITRADPRSLKEDRLCWALLTPSGNLPNINIYSQEQQELLVFEVSKDGRSFKIFSEDGHPGAFPRGGRPAMYRVALRTTKKYTGYIKIVSKETKGKQFFFEIDPSNRERPLKIFSPHESAPIWACFSEKCRLRCLGDSESK